MKKIIKIIGISFIILFFGSAAVAGLIEGITGNENNKTTITESSIPSIIPPLDEEKNNKEEEIEEEKNNKKPAPIEFYIIEHNQDYLGGNRFLISIKNLSQKQIKWIEFTLCCRNLKGEILKDTIRGWETIKWLDGPIPSSERIEKEYGVFYNGNFKGDVALIEVLIHYQDDSEEHIELFEFYEYESIFFRSGKNIVWYSEYSATYHTEECEYRKINHCDIGNSISIVRALGKKRCQFCKPY